MLLALIGVLVAYALLAVVLGLIPLNRDFVPADHGVKIFVTTNGMHADLVLPVQSDVIDWRTEYPTPLFPHVDEHAGYIAIGWGSRAFYLNTESWADLSAQTAAEALSGVGRSAMHIEYQPPPKPGADAIALNLSTDQYRELVTYIREHAIRDSGAHPVVIAGRHYNKHDAFFEAGGTYSALTTCNEWTRRALNRAGVRVPAWAPLDTALFYHLR
jgi:uncharacterized protein (TIGR02117 family)